MGLTDYQERLWLGTTTVEAADKDGWVVSITPSGGWMPRKSSSAAAGVMVWLVLLGELAIGLGLIFGVATRYVALFTFVFLIITIVLGHRYWTYPPAQQANQYAHFLKNLALMGGALMLFWSGARRYSVDARMG